LNENSSQLGDEGIKLNAQLEQLREQIRKEAAQNAELKKQLAAAQAQLQAGDVLVFYSDGITDARDPAGSFFGQERLLECLSQCRELGPEHVVAHVLGAAQHFARGTEQADDMTVAAVSLTL
jgi:sigma-B regulation protein RsbU (phosphoserine phosphatase)